MANPFYTRIYNKTAGLLARAIDWLNEYAAIETGFDAVNTSLGRNLKLPVGETDANSALAQTASQRASRVLGFDGSGKITTFEDASVGSSLPAPTPAGGLLRVDALAAGYEVITEAAMRTHLGLGTAALLNVGDGAGDVAPGSGSTSYAAVSHAHSTADISSGIFGLVRGGIGVNTLNDRGVLVGRGTSPVEATAAGADGAVFKGNGAGANPSFESTVVVTPSTLTISLSNDGATGGPDTVADRNSTTPAAGDVLGRHFGRGRNLNAASIDYVELDTEIDDPTAAAEQGRYRIRLKGRGNLTIHGTENSATQGPVVSLFRDVSTAPSAGWQMGVLRFDGRNSSLTSLTFGRVIAEIVTPTAGTEAGRLRFDNVIGGGSTTAKLYIGDGVYTPNAQGGDKAADTFNARGYHIDGLLPSGINGLVPNNSGVDSDHDIDFTKGFCADSTGAHMIVLTATLTKAIDTGWTAGNGGGLFAGIVAANTKYYFHAIRNPTTKVSDAGFDTSATAANAPSGFTEHRLLGFGLTDDSANWVQFTALEVPGVGAKLTHTVTPTWDADITSPAIGNGTLTGYYSEWQGMVEFTVNWTDGSTTTEGNGNYSFGPPTAIARNAIGNWAGSAKGEQSTVAFRDGATFIANGQSVFKVAKEGVSAPWGHVVPHTWGNGDTMTLSIRYRVD